MSPQILLFAIIATLAMGVGGYVAGRLDGAKLERAQQDRAVKAVEQSAKLGREATAEAIAGIQIKNVYSTQRLEKETITKPVYRDCVHDDVVFGLLIDAFTAPEDRKDVDNVGVSEAGPAGGENVPSDNH